MLIDCNADLKVGHQCNIDLQVGTLMNTLDFMRMTAVTLVKSIDFDINICRFRGLRLEWQGFDVETWLFFINFIEYHIDSYGKSRQTWVWVQDLCAPIWTLIEGYADLGSTRGSACICRHRRRELIEIFNEGYLEFEVNQWFNIYLDVVTLAIYFLDLHSDFEE